MIAKRILLTGATGLIGKEAMAPLIDRGFEIWAFTTDIGRARRTTSSPVNWIACDLLDVQAIKKACETVRARYLLHFAWIASGDYLVSELNHQWLSSSVALLTEFKKRGGERAVCAGTCFEYEFSGEPLAENGALYPKTVYAKCKDELRRQAERLSRESGLSFSWGRIFYVYGHAENEKRLTPHIINSLKANQEVVIKNGDLIRDYMYTKDIAGAFAQLVDSDVSGCVNICTGNPIKIGAYAHAIATKLGKDALLTVENVETDQPAVIVGDNTRLLNEVGYRPRYSLSEAIDRIIMES